MSELFEKLRLDDSDKFPFGVGESVEVRTANCDELYFAATVKSIECHETSSGENIRTATVIYDADGETESGILATSMKCNEQLRLYDDGEALVVTLGHIHIEGEGIRRARLLSFKSSPHLYQSAILLDQHSDKDDALDFTFIPFEVEQALALTIPIVASISAAFASRSMRCCVVGVGAGCLISSLDRCSGIPLEIVGIEVSDQMLKVARDFFGYRCADTRCKDGITAFDDTKEEEMFDVIVIDVAAPDAAAAHSELELPPESFVSFDFLRKANARLLPGGVIAVNVLATRGKLTELVERLVRMFTVYVLAVDPNYVLYLFPEHQKKRQHAISPSCVHQAAAKYPAMMHMCGPVLEEVKHTGYYASKNILLGWFDASLFLELLPKAQLV